MMPEPGSRSRWSASQASRCAGCGSVQHAQPQRLAVERAAQHQRPSPELLGDVGGDPGVGRGGGRQHRRAGRQLGQEGAQPPVVGAEVVAPVGDAVRLVDHEQAGGGGQLGQHVVAEVGIVEPLRADQQHVDRAAADLGGDLLPLVEVGRVDRAGVDAGPGGRLDLVAHQREQRRDDHGRARPPRRPAAARWRRSRPPTCPSRCAARTAPAAGRRPAPRSPATGPRAAGRASPASRRSTASARSRNSARSMPSFLPALPDPARIHYLDQGIGATESPGFLVPIP